MSGKILIVDDEKLICWSLKRDLEREGYLVTAVQTLAEGKRHFDEESPEVVLLDLRLPDGDGKDFLKLIRKQDPSVSVIVITANDDIRSAVECMQNGAFTYLHKPFDFDEIRVNLEKAFETMLLRKRVAEFESTERGKYDFENIICESPKMKAVLHLAAQLVEADSSTVMIEGESGTGKDLLARSIHYAGKRAARPFIPINCAAMPATLLESELFGHEKGAFTDAREMKKGLVEEASGGTLFLDEIADMSTALQAKLLHLIDQKKFRKVGGIREMDVDIRIIAATNKDLKKEVSEGRFREDLYYRIHVIPIYLPPLRDRKTDIPKLLSFFISHFNKEFKKKVTGLSPEALEILLHYDWPGNVRELKNVLERVMILNKEDIIRPEHLPAEIDCQCILKDSMVLGAESEPSKRLPTCLVGVPLSAVEKQVISLTLQKTDGNQSHAARLLGIGRDALRYKMRKFGFFVDDNDKQERKDEKNDQLGEVDL